MNRIRVFAILLIAVLVIAAAVWARTAPASKIQHSIQNPGSAPLQTGSPDMPICIPDQPCQYPNLRRI